MSPESIADLSKLLGEPGVIWVEYLESIGQAYSVSVQRKLDPEFKYEEAFNRYNEAFNVLHIATEGRLTETLKVGQSHSESFRVIQSHSESFRVIQGHSESFRVIQSHSESFRVIQSHSKLFRATQSHSDLVIY